MSDDRWVILGLAHPRAGWFRELARWATAGAVPVDFVKCVSPDEVRARLRGGRAYSALLVGGDTAGLDRDLVDTALTEGLAVIVVGPVAERDWSDLGVSSVISTSFERSELVAVLHEHATPIARIAQRPPELATDGESAWRGRLIAVTGGGGTGASITAMALAQSLAADPSNHGLVALADFALHAEQAMLHDARELVPGVQELAEAHRGGRLAIEEIRSMLFDAAGRGYHLLLGLRRHRDWTAVRPRAFDACLDGLLRSYRLVVADVDPEVEGEPETGSLDMEDRNLMARATLARADLVVVVGHGGTKGVHTLGRTIRELTDHGVPHDRILPTINRSPRTPARRADTSRALAALYPSSTAQTEIGNPVFMPERRDIDDAVHDGVRLPHALGRPLYDEVSRRLGILTPRRSVEAPVGVAVTPGSLGAWSEEAG